MDDNYTVCGHGTYYSFLFFTKRICHHSACCIYAVGTLYNEHIYIPCDDQKSKKQRNEENPYLLIQIIQGIVVTNNSLLAHTLFENVCQRNDRNQNIVILDNKCTVYFVIDKNIYQLRKGSIWYNRNQSSRSVILFN